jgi:adenosylcobinamide-GDP ribazoletransferase
MKNILFSFFSALSFLSRIPVPNSWTGGEKAFRNSLWFFPMVALLFAAILGTVFYLSSGLSVELRAFALVAVGVVLSGGLHIDGLMDTADGFFSGRDKSRILEIMKDPASGAMGVLAVMLTLGLRFFLLREIIMLNERFAMFCIALMPVAGRTAQLMTMCLTPCVSKSLGAMLWNRSKMLLLWNLTALSLSVFLYARIEKVNPVEPFWFWLLPGTVLWISALWSLWCRKKIGGATGDTLGAVSELTESAIPLLFLIVAKGFSV